MRARWASARIWRQQRRVPIGGGRGGPQHAGRRGGGLPGVQLRLGLPPPGVPGPVRAAQVRPGLRGRVPRGGVAFSGQPGALGIPGGALGRDRGHERMIGERGTRHLAHPRGQAVGGVHGGIGGVDVAARPGLPGQIGAGAHARRQQPPAKDRQVCGREQRKHLLSLLEGVGGPPRPQRQLRGPLPAPRGTSRRGRQG